jgi:hypothetical protein
MSANLPQNAHISLAAAACGQRACFAESAYFDLVVMPRIIGLRRDKRP